MKTNSSKRADSRFSRNWRPIAIAFSILTVIGVLGGIYQDVLKPMFGPHPESATPEITSRQQIRISGTLFTKDEDGWRSDDYKDGNFDTGLFVLDRGASKENSRLITLRNSGVRGEVDYAVNCSSNGTVSVVCALRLFEGRNPDLDGTGEKTFTVASGASENFSEADCIVENRGDWIKLRVSVQNQEIE